ncbi:MAG TPA: HNH endonuclease [Methylibium sp.]|nr:HNH endonuclease [Methylibium sp.]
MMREFWTDHRGRTWKVPQIRGRLKPGKCAGHAALREFVIYRDGGACRRCRSTERLVADHILSRRNGGSHHPDNLQCLCESCNARKACIEDRGRVA